MDRKEIGRRIEKLRKERNMSQYQLAMDAGISTSYIPDLEKGIKCPTVETLDSICYAFHITLSEFFANQEEKATYKRLESLSEKQKKLLNDFLDSL